VGIPFNRVAEVMNRPRDDEYGSLSDLMGGFDEGDSADSYEDDLPAGLPPEYAEAYRRGYERARRGEEPTVALEDELAAALESRLGDLDARRSEVDESDAGRPQTEEPDESPVDDLDDGEPETGEPDEGALDAGESHAAELETSESHAAEVEGDDSETGEIAAVGVGESGPEAGGPAQGSPEASGPAQGSTRSHAESFGWHEPTRAIPVGAVEPPRPSYAQESPEHEDFWDEDRRTRPVTLIAVAALALLLILGAFGIGRLFADDAAQDEAGTSTGSGETGETGGGGGGSQEKPERYAGPVDAVTIAGGSATCQTANSVDAAGNPTSYEPAKAFDSDISTAWRCDGSGQGQRFTVQLPSEVVVAEVGLVPGYAKTDPASGVDRYAENNRITKVRWRFDDGTTVVQKMGGDPGNRSMRTIRVPETATGSVVIEILASQPGSRNTVAISEIRVATPAG